MLITTALQCLAYVNKSGLHSQVVIIHSKGQSHSVALIRRKNRRIFSLQVFTQFAPSALQSMTQSRSYIDRRIHFSGLNLLEITTAYIRLLGKLLLSKTPFKSKATKVFTKLLVGLHWHPSDYRDNSILESELYFAF